MGKVLLSTIVIGLLSGGCSYYKITDPGSGKVYYTKDLMGGRYGYSGAIRFHDIPSDADVTLQSSEVKKVAESEVPPGPSH